MTEYEEAKQLLNSDDQYDNTPLHLACSKGNYEAVEILLDFEADIDNKNEDEQTPCHLAAVNNHVEIIRLIINKDRNAIFDQDEGTNKSLCPCGLKA